MPIGFLIGLGGGLASALLFYSAARGSPLFGTLLLVLTPLPSLLAGLGWGWLPAAAGAVAGALVMTFAANVPFAAGYFLALGLPVVLLPYLAYLSRPQPARPRHARVVSGGPPGRGALALWRRAAGARAAPDRRQLRGPAARHGRVLPPPLHARAGARPAASGRPADRGRSPSSSSPPCRARWRPTGRPSSRSTSIWAAASPAPPAGSGATGRTCRRWPIRSASRCSPRSRLPPPSRREPWAWPAPASPARCSSPTSSPALP